MTYWCIAQTIWLQTGKLHYSLIPANFKTASYFNLKNSLSGLKKSLFAFATLASGRLSDGDEKGILPRRQLQIGHALLPQINYVLFPLPLLSRYMYICHFLWFHLRHVNCHYTWRSVWPFVLCFIFTTKVSSVFHPVWSTNNPMSFGMKLDVLTQFAEPTKQRVFCRHKNHSQPLIFAKAYSPCWIQDPRDTVIMFHFPFCKPVDKTHIWPRSRRGWCT